MNKKDYLERLGIEQKVVAANLETLNVLQNSHLLKVPFENLDIHWKRPIVLDTNRFYRKIVDEKRGGFCYELNGLFNELLKQNGFQTRIISARVGTGTKEFGPEYDHLAILAKIGEVDFLVDVGFGDFSAAPLKLLLDIEQRDENGNFMIRRFDDHYFEVVKRVGEIWKSEYIFDDRTRELSEFTEMCQYHQNSPESHFTQGKLCSVMTKSGRKTLTDKKFITTWDGKKNETEVNSDEGFLEILMREFGIAKPF